MVATLQHDINGQRVDGASGRFGDVYNPPTGEITARVPLASAADVEKTIAAARETFPKLAAATPISCLKIITTRWFTSIPAGAGFVILAMK